MSKVKEIVYLLKVSSRNWMNHDADRIGAALSYYTLLSLAPKSVTAGVAMGIAEQFGGEAALTAVLVVTTGLIGAIIVTPLMNLLGLKNFAARGFAAGLVSHGIGTARAFQVNPLAGTFAGIALGLNGVLTAVLVPLLLPWLLG